MGRAFLLLLFLSITASAEKKIEPRILTRHENTSGMRSLLGNFNCRDCGSVEAGAGAESATESDGETASVVSGDTEYGWRDWTLTQIVDEKTVWKEGATRTMPVWPTMSLSLLVSRFKGTEDSEQEPHHQTIVVDGMSDPIHVSAYDQRTLAEVGITNGARFSMPWHAPD